MSKYYKAEDIEREIERLLQFKDENDFGFGVKYGIETVARGLKDLPTIEVSEDCISREFALKVISDYVNYPTEGDKTCAIKDAPSVVPSRAEGEPQTDYERGRQDAWDIAQKVFDSTVTLYEAEDVAKQIIKTERSEDERIEE